MSVTIRITNPAEPDRFWEDLFLVDLGTTGSLVPRPHLKAISLTPKGSRGYQLADGSDLALDITTADIEFMDEIVGETIIFGDADAEPLLGWTALESIDIEVDSRSQRLKRLPASSAQEAGNPTMNAATARLANLCGQVGGLVETHKKHG